MKSTGAITPNQDRNKELEEREKIEKAIEENELRKAEEKKKERERNREKDRSPFERDWGQVVEDGDKKRKY